MIACNQTEFIQIPQTINPAVTAHLLQIREMSKILFCKVDLYFQNNWTVEYYLLYRILIVVCWYSKTIGLKKVSEAQNIQNVL